MLEMIKDFFLFICREFGEREIEFLKEELINEECKWVIVFDLEKNFISMEFFYVDEELKEKNNVKYYK